MLAKELMKQEVERVLPSDTVHLAARTMRDANVGFLPVCDEDDVVLGTLTDRDIVIRLVAENRPATEPVATVMTGEVVACRPDDDIRAALARMREAQKARIVVTGEDGHLLGVISLSDIAQHVDAEQVAETMRQVTEREAA